MNQPMDIGAVMQGYILGATIRTACMMMLELMFTIIPRERERLKETVGHEPTNEDWEDYCQFLGERAANPKCLQRAKDREKIRRLVFGEGGGSSEAGWRRGWNRGGNSCLCGNDCSGVAGKQKSLA